MERSTRAELKRKSENMKEAKVKKVVVVNGKNYVKFKECGISMLLIGSQHSKITFFGEEQTAYIEVGEMLRLYEGYLTEFDDKPELLKIIKHNIAFIKHDLIKTKEELAEIKKRQEQTANTTKRGKNMKPKKCCCTNFCDQDATRTDKTGKHWCETHYMKNVHLQGMNYEQTKKPYVPKAKRITTCEVCGTSRKGNANTITCHHCGKTMLTDSKKCKCYGDFKTPRKCCGKE